MTDAELPDLDAQANVAVSALFADRGEMAIRWILVAEIIDADGDRVQVVASPPEATLVDALGLLHFGIEIQREEQS